MREYEVFMKAYCVTCYGRDSRHDIPRPLYITPGYTTLPTEHTKEIVKEHSFKLVGRILRVI